MNPNARPRLGFLMRENEARGRGEGRMPEEVYNRLLLHFDERLGGIDTVPHFHAMPSYQKVTDLAAAPIDPAICVATDKWDGVTISLLYVAGEFAAAITRGDKAHGADVSDKVATIAPASISEMGIVQFNAEVIALTNDPNDVHLALEADTGATFRRYRPRLVVFDVVPHGFARWSEAMAWAHDEGFDTVLDYERSDYPKDGVVYRIDDTAEFNASGAGIFALKFDPVT